MDYFDLAVEDSMCADCGEDTEDIERDVEPSEDMDGDAQSALANAGLGTDEDYEHYFDETPLGEEMGGE